MPEGEHAALIEELRGRLAEAGTWLAGGLPQDRVLAGAQLDQAAGVTGARMLGGSDELLDASVDEVSWTRSLHISLPRKLSGWIRVFVMAWAMLESAPELAALYACCDAAGVRLFI